jgi:hypothetical protein
MTTLTALASSPLALGRVFFGASAPRETDIPTRLFSRSSFFLFQFARPLQKNCCAQKMPSDNELHKAANKGDLEECKKWIETPEPGEDPLDVNGPGAADRRPLHRAAGAGHLAICEYFVSKGAIVDAVSRHHLFKYVIEKLFPRLTKVGGQRCTGLQYQDMLPSSNTSSNKMQTY